MQHIIFQGTVCVITSNLHTKVAMPDLQRYPYHPNLVQNVEDIVVFLTRKVFISVNFSIDFSKQEMRYATLAEKPQIRK